MAKISSIAESLNQRLGSDAKFPIEGNFTTIAGQELLLQDIQILLLTLPGERPFRPDYGCHLRNMIWENIQDAKEQGASSIRDALHLFEPRISVTNVNGTIFENTGLIVFNIQFIIKSTDTALNLVFPFRVGTQLSFA